MSGVSVVSAALRIVLDARRATPAIERGESARPCFSRSASASSADCALRGPASARARSRASSRSRLAASPDERLEQAQQRPPALHRPAEIVHRLGVGFRRVVDRRARLGEDVAGHRAQRLPHRHARPQGGPVVHAGGTIPILFHDRLTKGGSRGAGGLFAYGLSKPCHDCYIGAGAG